jgi:hypothetical protein
MSDFDPTVEINPNGILIAALIMVLAGFGVVAMIIVTGDAQPDAAAAAE